MRDVEYEYELLLDAVCAAVSLMPEEDFLAHASPRLQSPPRAANDNGGAWPLIPFPDGWYAAC